jgi:hypothetical protein
MQLGQTPPEPHQSFCKLLKKLTVAEAAYVAGIIDGEGTITLTRMHRSENRRPVVSISSTELALLVYVKAVVGAGRITNKARARICHFPSYAYTLLSRQALLLLGQIEGYLRTYKAERARLLLQDHLRVTPRNGRYTPAQRQAKRSLEERFFSIRVRALGERRELEQIQDTDDYC